MNDYVTLKKRIKQTLGERLRLLLKRRHRKWLERQIADLKKEQAHIARAISNYLRELEGL